MARKLVGSDLESFARGGPTLTCFFFFFVREDMIQLALKAGHRHFLNSLFLNKR